MKALRAEGYTLDIMPTLPRQLEVCVPGDNTGVMNIKAVVTMFNIDV